MRATWWARGRRSVAAGMAAAMVLSGMAPALQAQNYAPNVSQVGQYQTQPVYQQPAQYQQGQYPAQYQQPRYYQQYTQQYQYPQQYQYSQQYQYPQQYAQQYQQNWQPSQNWNKPLDNAGQSRLGRTMGGAAGIAAGSFGGAMLASAVIKAAGIATLGPVPALLVGTAITAGGAFLGGKALSMLGQEGDRLLGPDATFTLLGGIAGSVAGFALLPALGPFAGPAGRVIGAVLGGVVGGALAKLIAPVADKYAKPGMIYGAAGAALGGMGFGPIGALAGAAGGYAIGSIFDKNFFADRNGSVRGTIDDAREQVHDLNERFRDYRETVSDWVHDRTDRFRDRMSMRWNYYDHDSRYYDSYADARSSVNEYTGWGQRGYGLGYQNYSSESGFSGGLQEAKARYYRALEEFQTVNTSGTPSQRADAARRVHEAQVNYTRIKLQSGQ